MTVGAVTEVWAGLSGVVGRQWKQVAAGRFGATATRSFPPSLPPLRLCSWPTYAKALAPLSFLKAFLTRTFPWGAEIHHFAENLHKLSWKEERREEREDLNGLLSRVGMPKKWAFPCMINMEPSHCYLWLCPAKSSIPLPPCLEACSHVDWTPYSSVSGVFGHPSTPEQVGRELRGGGGVSLGSHKWVTVVGKGCLRKPTQN